MQERVDRPGEKRRWTEKNVFDQFHLFIPITGPNLGATSAKPEEKTNCTPVKV